MATKKAAELLSEDWQFQLFYQPALLVLPHLNCLYPKSIECFQALVPWKKVLRTLSPTSLRVAKDCLFQKLKTN